MSEINYGAMTVTPYEYWDLRLRHFRLIQQDPRLPDAVYEMIRDTLISELNDFLKGQEDGLKETAE